MDTYPPISTFLSLRKWTGYAGMWLPVLVVVFAWGFLPSISDSYYAGDLARTWFVGSLFTIGAFLCSYCGYDDIDRHVSTVAGVCAFGVALCPTDPAGAVHGTLAGKMHYGYAATLFGILAWFALVQFRKTSAAKMTAQKETRNKIYRVCGCVIVACLVVLLVLKLTGLGDRLRSAHPVFWLEALALEAFGFSWLIKGEAFLKDEPPPGTLKTVKPPSS